VRGEVEILRIFNCMIKFDGHAQPTILFISIIIYFFHVIFSFSWKLLCNVYWSNSPGLKHFCFKNTV